MYSAFYTMSSIDFESVRVRRESDFVSTCQYPGLEIDSLEFGVCRCDGGCTGLSN